MPTRTATMPRRHGRLSQTRKEIHARSPRKGVRPHQAPHAPKKKTENVLRVMALGGLGEVGRNMTLLEWRDYAKDTREILIIDIGLRFPEEDMPGIDFIIPNVKYLEDKKKDIVGLIFTHGHYDHIGALPYVLEKIGNPLIYAAALTRGIILRRHEEFKHLPKLKMIEVKNGDIKKMGPFEVEFVHVNHSIPDDMALAVGTPVGTVFATSDFKFDHSPIIDKPAEIDRLRAIGDRGVTLMLADSTGAEKTGHSPSESDIQHDLEMLVKDAPGRVIVGTFASSINRVQQLIDIAEKHDKRVNFQGYSMKSNVEVSRALGYIKAKKGTVIEARDIDRYPDNKILVIGTGGQGEENAMLMRLATHRHREIKLKKGDTIIFSSSVIAGNERTVQHLKDNLIRNGTRVFTYQMLDIHAGGHGQQDDLRFMLELIRPTFFMPVHGQLSMLYAHKEIAMKIGMPEEKIIVIENGQVVRLNKDHFSIDEKTIPTNYVMVDGLGVGDVGSVVLRDRQQLAADGMFVLISVIDAKSGRVIGNPDIISRGFVYLRDQKELLAEARKRVKQIVEKATAADHPFNEAYVKDEIREKIGQFLFSKTHRRPMVLPVLIEV